MLTALCCSACSSSGSYLLSAPVPSYHVPCLLSLYESNTRTPKEELLRKIAEVLDVNYRSLYEPTLYAAEDVMYTLFELDEHYPGTRLYEVTDTTDPDLPEKHMAVSFRYRLLDDFLKEWQLRKKQLREGEITKEEYLEWKLNWPQTADGCGHYEPKKSGATNKRHKNAL